MVERTTFSGQGLVDIEGGYSVCAYRWPDQCSDVSVTNNIAAGVRYAGFVVPAHDCDSQGTQSVFRGNVAHSVSGMASGEGLVVYPTGGTHSTCFQASHFSAYKISVAAVNSFQVSAKTVMSDMTLVDNNYGLAVNLVCPSDYADNEIVLKDSFISGGSISPDCPENGGFCASREKAGIMLGGACRGGKSPHNPRPSPRPHYKIKSDACWAGKYTISNNQFVNFDGATERAFVLSPHASDMIPIIVGSGNQFADLAPESLGFFYDPPASWANPTDCGDFPCTAPWNVLMYMSGSSFTGTSPEYASSNF